MTSLVEMSETLRTRSYPALCPVTPQTAQRHPKTQLHVLMFLQYSTSKSCSLPGVLLPTELQLNYSPGLLPFLGAGTPALRLVQVRGVWRKHCWEQGQGKGRSGHQADEQLLRIPAHLR